MRRLFENLSILVGSTLVLLLLAEGTLRVLGFHPTPIAPDRTIGYRWRPHARYRWTEEGFSEGRANAAGWLDRDHAVEKPPGTTRILICGDSFVEARQVPLDGRFHRRLERLLNERALPGQRFEVIAFGQSGAGTTQEYLMYRKWGARYQPDIVAVLFFLNDWTDNWPMDPAHPVRPYLVESGDSLRLDTSFVDTPEFRRSERLGPYRRLSSLVTVVANALSVLRVRTRPTREEAGLVKREGPYGTWNFHVPPPADSIPAFRLTARILERFSDEVRRDGRRFVLIVAGAAQQEDAQMLVEESRDPTFDPDKTWRWLVGVGRRYGFDVVPLTPAFRASCQAGGPPLWCGGRGKYSHWNAAGHALAAEVLADYLAGRE